MIVFLTLAYVAVLGVLIKLKVVKPTPLAKASPGLWFLLLFVGLFIPMQFWAPAGKVRLVQYSVQIVPSVAGEVLEVPVKANTPLKKGDVLFKIDPTLYQATVDKTRAQLELARVRLEQAQELAKARAGSRYDVQKSEAEVRQYEAGLSSALWNLEHTVVRAPADGFVTSVALRPGHRVSNFPFAPAMVFYETSERLLVAQIPEAYLRYVKPGAEVEVTFKMLPGEVFTGKVEQVLQATAAGSFAPGGAAAGPQSMAAGAYHVKITPDAPASLEQLPAGAVGSVAIYSEHGKPTHVIRKVMLRMDAWMNYVDPS